MRTAKRQPFTKADRLLREGIISKKQQEIHMKIESLVQKSVQRDKLATQSYYFLMVNYFTKEVFTPAELAASQFNLKKGVQDIYHTLINPVFGVYGSLLETQEHVRSTHQLPLPPNAIGNDNLDSIQAELLQFLRSESGVSCRLPPVFTLQDEMRAVTKALTFLNGGVTSQLKVYPIEYLFFVLKEATCDAGMLPAPEAAHFTNLQFELNPHKYLTEIACDFHKVRDLSKHCTKSYVTRWGYAFSKNMCSDLAIKMIPNRHMPSNPDAFKPDKYDEKEGPFNINTDPTSHDEDQFNQDAIDALNNLELDDIFEDDEMVGLDKSVNHGICELSESLMMEQVRADEEPMACEQRMENTLQPTDLIDNEEECFVVKKPIIHQYQKTRRLENIPTMDNVEDEESNFGSSQESNILNGSRSTNRKPSDKTKHPTPKPEHHLRTPKNNIYDRNVDRVQIWHRGLPLSRNSSRNSNRNPYSSNLSSDSSFTSQFNLDELLEYRQQKQEDKIAKKNLQLLKKTIEQIIETGQNKRENDDSIMPRKQTRMTFDATFTGNTSHRFGSCVSYDNRRQSITEQVAMDPVNSHGDPLKITEYDYRDRFEMKQCQYLPQIDEPQHPLHGRYDTSTNMTIESRNTEYNFSYWENHKTNGCHDECEPFFAIGNN